MSAPHPSRAAAPAASQGEEAGDRLLVGAAAIAAFLSISERRVYAMKESGAPIGKVPGLGLAVRVATLRAYLDGCAAHAPQDTPGRDQH